jgi:H+/Cl- antiporter ClcA
VKEGVEVSQISEDRHSDLGPDAPAGSGQLAREQAIKQIERKRRFKISTALGTLAMIVVVIIWATTEYHNAGGWPTQGFSQSSSIPNTWNIWIIYPLVAYVVTVVGYAWFVYGNKPISEAEIKREIDRQAGP